MPVGPARLENDNDPTRPRRLQFLGTLTMRDARESADNENDDDLIPAKGLNKTQPR